jgi:hypothetical protein
MPDLVKSLQGRDLGHLFIVAELWGIDLGTPEEHGGLDIRRTLQRLVPSLLDKIALQEMIDSLPAEAKIAFEELAQADGRLPWQLFTRRYGVVREMGPGRRDRDQPYLAPVSPAEILWYRGLLARAFFESPTGLEEFAYIPDDLLLLIPVGARGTEPTLGRLASPAERAFPLPASDHLVDHACTLLAALRLDLPTPELQALVGNWQPPIALARLAPFSLDALLILLRNASLINSDNEIQPEPLRIFLEGSRAEALSALVNGWLPSQDFNELRLLPGVEAEGEWQNDPRRARQDVLDFLAVVPGLSDANTRPFWSLSSFVDDIHQRYPDFQRPAGDYDSWFLHRKGSDEFLRGFEHWQDVEGAMISYIIAGPLHWLGILDLAASGPPTDPAAQITAFRYSDWAASLLRAQPPEGLPKEEGFIQVRSDARLILSRLTPRAVRYQVARFGYWEKEQEGEYHYLLTPSSLARARGQSLNTNHLLSLLRRYARTVPPSLVRALDRWDKNGGEARIEDVTILRLSSPEIMQELRASRAARFLGDPVGPVTIIVKPGAAAKVLAALAELGYLGEIIGG